MKLSLYTISAFLILGINAIPPASFDWRDQGIITPVKNQGYCGSDYAFASAGLMEAYLKWKTNTTYDISEQDIVDCSYGKIIDDNQNNGCQGGSPTVVFEYFNVKDIVPESSYPYTSGSSQIHGQCRVPSPVNNIVKGKLKAFNIRTTRSIEEQMKELLVSKGPLVVRIGADNEFKRFFDDLGDGVFDNIAAINLQPNQWVLLVGYGTQNGKEYWLFKNSWGAEWANNGFGKIARGKNMCNITYSGVWYVEM
ncbi:unnamed protein product [Cunninghamella blakesleeana]